MPNSQQNHVTLELNLHSITRGALTILADKYILSSGADIYIRNSYIARHLIHIVNPSPSSIHIKPHQDWNFVSCCMITEGITTDFLNEQDSAPLLGIEHSPEY